ncbi:hypothetical protein chmu007 [Choristoneura murinana nucleopolyhedrovirus]|uniref:Uncharacterized protein n=1 Tax=Choristoneura murinana nucleopolyhedrovirus TaxID=1987479 RepID=V9XSH4_9ABAC|nr:hypothetical protein chmu007 [Choristoneura murinana nucleopolyhedrovirus]AHD25494.1 hypothetical protein chmu007 [Choristoneura murinana nucleopolyhedrovirus]
MNPVQEIYKRSSIIGSFGPGVPSLPLDCYSMMQIQEFLPNPNDYLNSVAVLGFPAIKKKVLEAIDDVYFVQEENQPTQYIRLPKLNGKMATCFFKFVYVEYEDTVIFGVYNKYINKMSDALLQAKLKKNSNFKYYGRIDLEDVEFDDINHLYRCDSFRQNVYVQYVHMMLFLATMKQQKRVLHPDTYKSQRLYQEIKSFYKCAGKKNKHKMRNILSSKMTMFYIMTMHVPLHGTVKKFKTKYAALKYFLHFNKMGVNHYNVLFISFTLKLTHV